MLPQRDDDGNSPVRFQNPETLVIPFMTPFIRIPREGLDGNMRGHVYG